VVGFEQLEQLKGSLGAHVRLDIRHWDGFTHRTGERQTG
jgi:hypothetical protein